MGIALKTISRIIIDLSSEANNKNSKTFLPPFFYLSKKGCEAWRKNWLLHFWGASDLSWFLEIKVRRGFECLIEEVYEEIPWVRDVKEDCLGRVAEIRAWKRGGWTATRGHLATSSNFEKYFQPVFTGVHRFTPVSECLSPDRLLTPRFKPILRTSVL